MNTAQMNNQLLEAVEAFRQAAEKLTAATLNFDQTWSDLEAVKSRIINGIEPNTNLRAGAPAPKPRAKQSPAPAPQKPGRKAVTARDGKTLLNKETVIEALKNIGPTHRRDLAGMLAKSIDLQPDAIMKRLSVMTSNYKEIFTTDRGVISLVDGKNAGRTSPAKRAGRTGTGISTSRKKTGAIALNVPQVRMAFEDMPKSAGELANFLEGSMKLKPDHAIINVRYSGNATYMARAAGLGITASCTSGPDQAANACAAKVFPAGYNLKRNSDRLFIATPGTEVA